MIKYKPFIIKTFNQVKNDNFDQVKFDQVFPCKFDGPVIQLFTLFQYFIIKIVETTLFWSIKEQTISHI